MAYGGDKVNEINEAELKDRLDPLSYSVLREGATERPFTGDYTDTDKVGSYRCKACGNELFRSDCDKYLQYGFRWIQIWVCLSRIDYFDLLRSGCDLDSTPHLESQWRREVMFYNISRRVLLFIFAVAVIVPSSIVVLGSFKQDLEIYTKPLALPKHWSFSNFSRLIHEGNVITPFKNSLFVTSFSVVLTLTLASMCAFAISRMITVTGKVLFTLFALGLAIPGQVNIIPIYLLFVKLHLNNSLIGLILVNVAVTLPISIFILTAFFRDLPREMIEASGIDGAGMWRTYRSIALPLSKPAMGATGIFLFVICWNDLLYPLMLITQSDKKTLPLTLIDFRGEYATSYSMLFTAIMVASIPMVLMYIFMQKSFVAGLTAGAVKG